MDNYRYCHTLNKQLDCDDVAFHFLVFNRKYDIWLHLLGSFALLL